MSTLSSRTVAQYDEDYYERGVESGKSCYSNYRWLPDLTIPMAMVLIDALGIRPRQRVLDFGCAKGFTVKALRILRRDAFGIDVSPYAISQADRDIAPHVGLVDDLDSWSLTRRFDHVIAKDVLEHVPYEVMDDTIQAISRMTDSFMVVVPLGREGRFVIEAYERDVTHIVREDAAWWLERLERHFADVAWQHHLDGLKDNWHRVNPKGNAVFIARGSRLRAAA
ncbi:MAG: methyltransferase domain-containing protein [Phycisphaerales bacterium]|nr:methyltransferase domain-containing protein [Phycisphaerales bacterium]